MSTLQRRSSGKTFSKTGERYARSSGLHRLQARPVCPRHWTVKSCYCSTHRDVSVRQLKPASDCSSEASSLCCSFTKKDPIRNTSLHWQVRFLLAKSACSSTMGCSWSDCCMPCWRAAFTLEGNPFQRPKTQRHLSHQPHLSRRWTFRWADAVFLDGILGFSPYPSHSQPPFSVRAVREVVQHCPVLTGVRLLEGQHSVNSAACPLLFTLAKRSCARVWGFLGVYCENPSVVPG